MTLKNPTPWIPTTGQGYVVIPGRQLFQDNLGHLIIDNLGNNLVTNPAYVIGKFATAWAETGV